MVRSNIVRPLPISLVKLYVQEIHIERNIGDCCSIPAVLRTSDFSSCQWFYPARGTALGRIRACVDGQLALKCSVCFRDQFEIFLRTINVPLQVLLACSWPPSGLQLVSFWPIADHFLTFSCPPSMLHRIALAFPLTSVWREKAVPMQIKAHIQRPNSKISSDGVNMNMLMRILEWGNYVQFDIFPNIQLPYVHVNVSIDIWWWYLPKSAIFSQTRK